MSFGDILGLEGSGLKIHIWGNHHTWEIQTGTDISGILKEEVNYQVLINNISWFETKPGGIRREFPMFGGQMNSATKTEENYNDLTITNWDNLTAPNNINMKNNFFALIK